MAGKPGKSGGASGGECLQISSLGQQAFVWGNFWGNSEKLKS